MEEKPSYARVALKWGLILAVVQIIFSTFLFLLDQMGNTGLSSIAYVFIITALVMAMREYRTMNNGFMSYGEGLGIGTLASAISGLLSSVYSVFYMTLIDPTVMASMVDKTREQLETKGFSDEQIEQQLEIMQKFQSPGWMFLFGILGTIFLGFIFSLIISAILKKNRPVFE